MYNRLHASMCTGARVWEIVLDMCYDAEPSQCHRRGSQIQQHKCRGPDLSARPCTLFSGSRQQLGTKNEQKKMQNYLCMSSAPCKLSDRVCLDLWRMFYIPTSYAFLDTSETAFLWIMFMVDLYTSKQHSTHTNSQGEKIFFCN